MKRKSMADSELDTEISQLESRLQTLKEERDHGGPRCHSIHTGMQMPSGDQASAFHSILLLSDSALPLGSFAFSSGLESFLAHEARQPYLSGLSTFQRFLSLSMASLKSTTLPYVRAAFCEPKSLTRLDNDFDASTTCKVAKRASTSQGKALIALWDRSLKRNSPKASGAATQSGVNDAVTELDACSTKVKAALIATVRNDQELPDPSMNCHLAPLFGALCAALSLSLGSTLYLFFLNHAKTLSSAAIRASLLGPYQAQSILASEWLIKRVSKMVESELDSPASVDDAGQSVPSLDLWGGRHEIVYSRIFNS